jgi:RHS repeat-associated protein
MENPALSTKALKQNYFENRRKFNAGSELQNKEFIDGSGLELYDFNARMYDPQIGRFLHVDPLANLDFNLSPFAYASDNPILLNDPTGLVGDTGTNHYNIQAFTVTAKKPLDTENGQVFESRSALWDILDGPRYFISHDKFGWPRKYEVDRNGYLTGRINNKIELLFDAPFDRAPILNLKAVFNIKNFIKGRYAVYKGIKGGLEYVGKARGGIEFRYSAADIEKMEVQVIKGLDNLPNNAVALGVEQLVIDLNGGAGTGELANKINATVKEIYVNEARFWLNNNIPNWESALKIK